jgi:hypothetical protein
MTDRNHDQDRDVDRDRDHDKPKREDKALAPAPTGGALTSLQALEVALSKVDTSSVAGRTGKPLLQFKSRENAYVYGQKKTVPEDGSHWAVDPRTFKRGWISFGNGNKKLGERLASVSKPLIDVTTLPDYGFPWQEEWTVDMKCVSGADTGLEVVFAMSTDGGTKAIVGLLDAVKDRVESGQHNGDVAPIMLLEKDSYVHGEHARIWYPVLTVVAWMPLEGPPPASIAKPAPAPTRAPSPGGSSAADQPRRRRVA